MRIAAQFGAVTLAVMVATGCREEPPAAPVPPAQPVQSGPTKANPKLPTIKLFVGTNELETELAFTPLQMQTGMMFRQTMADTEGMLFRYAEPQRASFWMKNVTVPLSCAYIDSQGIIREIYDMEPGNEISIVSKSDQIRYCLEVPQGWFQRRNVGVGVGVSTARGTMSQSFFGGK